METTQAAPVIAEVRAVRDRFAARADYDVGAIFRRVREMQNESERKLVPRDPSNRYCTRRALSTTTSARGTSAMPLRAPVSASSIRSATSRPATSWPNTV